MLPGLSPKPVTWVSDAACAGTTVTRPISAMPTATTTAASLANGLRDLFTADSSECAVRHPAEADRAGGGGSAHARDRDAGAAVCGRRNRGPMER